MTPFSSHLHLAPCRQVMESDQYRHPRRNVISTAGNEKRNTKEALWTPRLKPTVNSRPELPATLSYLMAVILSFCSILDSSSKSLFTAFHATFILFLRAFFVIPLPTVPFWHRIYGDTRQKRLLYHLNALTYDRFCQRSSLPFLISSDLRSRLVSLSKVASHAIRTNYFSLSRY